MAKLTAVTRITYEPRTDLITIVGRRAVGGIPAIIARTGYEVVRTQIMGWGDHNTVIYVDLDGADDDIGGYWLATIQDA